MPHTLARAISILFPEYLASHEWFETFSQMLAEIPNSHVTTGKVTSKQSGRKGLCRSLKLLKAR